jgi:hypothetical protein
MILATDTLRENVLVRLQAAGVDPVWAQEMAAAASPAAESAGLGERDILWKIAVLLCRSGLRHEADAVLDQLLPGLRVAGPLPDLPRPVPDWIVSRVLRPGRTAGEWTLDLAKVAGHDGMGELAYGRLLPGLAALLAAVWDASSGEGQLAVAGLLRHARALSSGRQAGRRARAWREDLEAALSAQGTRRNWTHQPIVVLADAL